MPPKMLKLDEDFFDEICDEIIRNDNKEHKSLLNFMLLGKKPLDSAIRWFSTLEIQDVQISGNIWMFFEDDRFSFKRKADWVFDNFPFIKYISLAIVENVKVVTLQDATPKCFAFLQQVTSLKTLDIKVSSVKKFKELLPALKSLISVEELELSIPHGTVKLFDLLNFNIKRITCNLFDMEKAPVCKVRNDIESFELLEERNPKKNFMFEPQHFRNYEKLFPNSRLDFTVNHTVTDKDLPEVYKFFERRKKNIAVEVEMVVHITYYNLAPIMESKMYKELRRLAFNPGVIYEPFMLKENNYGIFMFYKYDFPQRLEVAKSKWNQRVMYTKTIPKKFQQLFKPEDFVIVQTRDNYKNIVLFKFPWDLPLPVFKKFYGEKVGVNNLIFYFYGCRIGSGNYNETMRTFQRFKRGELNLPNIIEIAPELYG